MRLASLSFREVLAPLAGPQTRARALHAALAGVELLFFQLPSAAFKNPRHAAQLSLAMPAEASIVAARNISVADVQKAVGPNLARVVQALKPAPAVAFRGMASQAQYARALGLQLEPFEWAPRPPRRRKRTRGPEGPRRRSAATAGDLGWDSRRDGSLEVACGVRELPVTATPGEVVQALRRGEPFIVRGGAAQALLLLIISLPLSGQLGDERLDLPQLRCRFHSAVQR